MLQQDEDRRTLPLSPDLLGENCALILDNINLERQKLSELFSAKSCGECFKMEHWEKWELGRSGNHINKNNLELQNNAKKSKKTLN